MPLTGARASLVHVTRRFAQYGGGGYQLGRTGVSERLRPNCLVLVAEAEDASGGNAPASCEIIVLIQACTGGRRRCTGSHGVLGASI